MIIIRLFYDAADQGHSLHFCPDEEVSWHTSVSPFRVLVKDAWLRGAVKSEMDRLILYSDRKTIPSVEDLFGDVEDSEEQYGRLPWEMAGQIPLSKRDKVLDNLAAHPWMVPTWMECDKPEGFESFFNITREITKLASRVRMVCKDGPHFGDVCNVKQHETRHRYGDHVYEVVGNDLLHVRTDNGSTQHNEA